MEYHLPVTAFHRTESLHATESCMKRVLKHGTTRETHVHVFRQIANKSRSAGLQWRPSWDWNKSELQSMSGPNMPKSLFGVPVICPLTRLLPSWTWQTNVLFSTCSRILLGTFSSDIALKLLQLVSSSFLCSGVSLAVFQLVNTILFLMQRQNIDRLSCRPLALKALEVCCPGILLFLVLSFVHYWRLRTRRHLGVAEYTSRPLSTQHAPCPQLVDWGKVLVSLKPIAKHSLVITWQNRHNFVHW